MGPRLARSLAPLALVGLAASAAEARTPREPPTPSHCLTACRGSASTLTSLDCQRRCAARWRAAPWRDKVTLEHGKPAVACVARERACRAKKNPKAARCLRRAARCLRRALGFSPTKVARCWAVHRRQARRCAGREGRAGWHCRNSAKVALHRCRARARTRRTQGFDEAYRLAATVDDALEADLSTAAP